MEYSNNVYLDELRAIKIRLENSIKACESLLEADKYKSTLPTTEESQPSEAELEMMYFSFKMED